MDNSSLEKKISLHIGDNLFHYYPNLDRPSTTIRLIEQQHRPSSSIYRYQISDRHSQYRILAKGVPEKPDHDPAIEERARLVPHSDDFSKELQMEYMALKSIGAHFQGLNDRRFGVIELLDYIPDTNTIIMEENGNPSLRTLFGRTNLLYKALKISPKMHGAFYNAGAWLKSFSSISPDAGIRSRCPRVDDFKDSIVNYSAFLARTSGNKDYFQRIRDITLAAANEHLPDPLPLGLGHGDYAMRNILVGTGDCVTVLDTRANFKVPIYEDIAYFLVHMETNKLQLMTQGIVTRARFLDELKQAFLSGYFEKAAIPSRELSLFQIQLFLDSWSARASMYAAMRNRGRDTIYSRINSSLLDRGYRIILDKLLGEIDTSPR